MQQDFDSNGNNSILIHYILNYDENGSCSWDFLRKWIKNKKLTCIIHEPDWLETNWITKTVPITLEFKNMKEAMLFIVTWK